MKKHDSNKFQNDLKFAASICRDYRTACVEHDHYFKLYNWHLNQLNKISESLEARQTDVVIELDLAIRDMISRRSTCVCPLKKIARKEDVKCRKTGPSRTILDKKTLRMRKMYQEAKDRKWKAHNKLFVFLYENLYDYPCVCNDTESDKNVG